MSGRRFLFQSLLLLSTFGSACISSSALAKDSDGGFFFRSSLGVGHSWAHAEQTNDQSDLDMQSWTGALMLSPGYEFFPGLAAHADVLGAMHFAHKLNLDAESDAYDHRQVGLMDFLLGAGLTYRPFPGSLYVSGGIGFSEVWGSRWRFEGEPGLSELDTGTAASYPGYALYGSVGKLFDSYERWSVGGSLNYSFKAVGRPEEDDLTIGKVHMLWLGFTAVFHPKRKK